MELKAYLNENKILVENELHKAWNDFLHSDISKNIPAKLADSMSYSLFSGGKRFRPILVLAAAEAVNPNFDKELCLKAGISIEFIHTYSLIHDDLPCMDDADYRRAKLTNHKKYGEAMAVLAGDALLTYAFGYVADTIGQTNPKAAIDIISQYSAQSGARGMVAGQARDLLYTNKELSPQEMGDEQTYLEKMDMLKTSCLFVAALRAGGMIASADEQQISTLNKYGKSFGLAFQITDDILDGDGFAKYYGIQASKNMAKNAVNKALEALKDLPGNTETLASLVNYLMERVQ